VTHRLLLLRHGEVTSHRGDVAVTARGLDSAEDLGRRLAATADRIRVLTGETLRTRQTGAAIATGASAAGATVEQLMELESFGLVSARGSGERGAWYGGDDLVLLRLARELGDYGLEARHLRMYKLFAEREAALFEQVVAPLVRQRNPEARARARDTIDALAQLGGRMRDLALRSAVHGLAETRDPRR
jgi:hypothetical protein